MKPFKVGDRVIRVYGGLSFPTGAIATVIKIGEDDEVYVMNPEIEKLIIKGDCDENGWGVLTEYLRHLTKLEEVMK